MEITYSERWFGAPRVERITSSERRKLMMMTESRPNRKQIYFALNVLVFNRFSIGWLLPKRYANVATAKHVIHRWQKRYSKFSRKTKTVSFDSVGQLNWSSSMNIVAVYSCLQVFERRLHRYHSSLLLPLYRTKSVLHDGIDLMVKYYLEYSRYFQFLDIHSCLEFYVDVVASIP